MFPLPTLNYLAFQIKHLGKLKIAFLMLPFVTLLSSGLLAQDQKRTWVVRANLGSSIGITNISLEKALSDKHSISLLPSYGYFTSADYHYETYGIGLDYRYYFAKSSVAPKGFYVSAGGSLAKGKTKNDVNGESYDTKGFSTQAVAGKQWIFKKGFAIDINVGVEYLKLDATGYGHDYPFKFFLPSVGGGVGYSF